MGERIDGIRSALGSNGSDAYFSVFGPANQYVSGMMTSFMEISSAIVITGSDAHFMCDFRYTEQAKEEVADFTIEEITGDILVRAGEHLTKIGASRAAYDPNGLTVAELERLESAFEGTLVADGSVVSRLRLVKTDEEVEAIRAASNLAEGVLCDLLPSIEEGVPERELAATFEYEFKKRGASGSSFDTIALFGPKSSLPHGEPGDKRLAKGDVVLLDFGCRKGGYCSDMTRTYVFCESPGEWFDEIYSVTLDAQLRSLDAIEPGKTGKEIDTVARTIIGDAGYGEYFGHGLGHGVGVEIHEAPRLNAHSDTVLEPGMIVTVEPGIYLPGQGGVRIEDLVVLTENGYELLTTMPKELTILGL